MEWTIEKPVTGQTSNQTICRPCSVEATCLSFHISSLERGAEAKGRTDSSILHSCGRTPYPEILGEGELELTLMRTGGRLWPFPHPFENRPISIGMWDNLLALIFGIKVLTKTQKSKGSFGHTVLACKLTIKPLHFAGQTGRASPTEALTIFSSSHFCCRAILSFLSPLICVTMTQGWNKIDFR